MTNRAQRMTPTKSECDKMMSFLAAAARFSTDWCHHTEIHTHEWHRSSLEWCVVACELWPLKLGCSVCDLVSKCFHIFFPAATADIAAAIMHMTFQHFWRIRLSATTYHRHNSILNFWFDRVTANKWTQFHSLKKNKTIFRRKSVARLLLLLIASIFCKYNLATLHYSIWKRRKESSKNIPRCDLCVICHGSGPDSRQTFAVETARERESNTIPLNVASRCSRLTMYGIGISYAVRSKRPNYLPGQIKYSLRNVAPIAKQTNEIINQIYYSGVTV